jgi:hypothetical protein
MRWYIALPAVTALALVTAYKIVPNKKARG